MPVLLDLLPVSGSRLFPESHEMSYPSPARSRRAHNVHTGSARTSTSLFWHVFHISFPLLPELSVDGYYPSPKSAVSPYSLTLLLPLPSRAEVQRAERRGEFLY
ncbi:hypothetical protein BDQ12DRAFT_139624 [Crucibulum laeve]|uniref:Uncharacterized protein n=1 Tax=Crucibulum laeve TaxID=68775 RepID=A0A5C3LX19_9AGAR|nr:hypothetical protein BDQ12DRAFT_139624 [Crucibulum laeve]